MLNHWVKLGVLSVLTLFVVVVGCSKKQEPAATQPAAAAVEAAPAAADAAPQAPTGPVLDATQMGDARQAMADADAALRKREYEKAVRTMLAIQQAQLNAQQAAAARQAMVELQKNLATAIASGDPNAQAAAQLLRAAHSR